MKDKLIALVFALVMLSLAACGGDDSSPEPTATAFVHTAAADNIVAHWTVISHPELDGNPDAILLVTQNWNPGGIGGTHIIITVSVSGIPTTTGLSLIREAAIRLR